MTLRLGLLSTAKINDEILAGAAASTRVEIVAVASRDAARAQAYAAEKGLGCAHASYEALLADDGVDAVYIGLPNGLHVEWSIRALEAGKHVLCEKPLTRSPKEAERAFDAADEAGLVLMEAFMWRHHPQARVVKELVDGGAVGKLRLIRSAFSFTLADTGDHRYDLGLEGGSLMDVGCYCVSGSRLLAGEPESALGEAVLGPGGVDLSFHGTLRFPGDVVAQFDSSFALPRRQFLEVVGEDGVLEVEAPWRVDFGGRVLLNGEEVDVPPGNAYRLQLDNFAEAAAGLAGPLLGRADAVGQARAIDALYRSAAEGRAVTL